MRSLLFLLVLFAVPVAQAQRFVLADTIRTAQATGLQWGDYDADGDMDLLVSATTGLAVYRSDGGRLVPLTFYDPYSDLALGTSGTWADVDADGRLELVANGMAYAITGNVLVPVEQPLYWRCKGAPDLNRDGFADRISYGTITHTLAAYEFSLNRGDCTQRQVFRELYQDDSYPSNTVADFDGDGDLDFLVGNSMALNDGATTPAFHPLVGVGGGFFPMMGSYDAAGRTTADLDDDGDLDILGETRLPCLTSAVVVLRRSVCPSLGVCSRCRSPISMVTSILTRSCSVSVVPVRAQRCPLLRSCGTTGVPSRRTAPTGCRY
jgi:hypothetical protein